MVRRVLLGGPLRKDRARLTENALKCKYNGGGQTIGYVIDEEQYFQIDPLSAPLVLEAFKMYDKGATRTGLKL